MRRFFLAILTALSMLMCCSCSSSVSLKNPSESGFDSVITDKKAAAKDWEECDKSEMQTFTGENGGLAFTIYTDKREYAVGETVRVKTEVKNVSGGGLYYTSRAGCNPIGIVIDCGMPKREPTGMEMKPSYPVSMRPDEVYEDYVSFEANCADNINRPGKYKGFCCIYTVPYPDHKDVFTPRLTDFSIMLTNDEYDPEEDPLYILEQYKTDKDLWEECDKSEMQTFTREDGGLLLTVYTDKREYTVGETVKVKAVMRNITDSDIYYPSGGEILPRLDNPRDGETLYTGWLKGYCVDACTNSFNLSPGEVDGNYYVFETRYYTGGTAEPGKYNGICNFYTVPYSVQTGEYIEHPVNFSITLKQSDQTPQ